LRRWFRRWKRQAASPSGEGEPTINNQNLPGDEVRAGGKEEYSLSNVGDGAIVTHGGFGSETRRLRFRPSVRISGGGRRLGQRGVGEGGGIVSIDPAGRDTIDADFGRESLCHGLREHVEGSL